MWDSTPKKITSATLGLEAKIAPTPSITSHYSQKYFISYKIFWKRKYYRELISYEQCRLARIIGKGGWTVVSWRQYVKTICLITSDIL